MVIEVNALSKSYRRGLWGRPLLALRGVSLNVGAGEVFGLLGPNGAGKTTLIKLLLGILHPSRGTGKVLGEPIGSRAARRRIGYLPENLVFPRHHTALGALRFYGRLSGVPESHIRAREGELIQLVGLAGREHDVVRKYSKGMRQRLGLAQAMLHEPDVLILDEPTDGLDPLGRSQIRDLIQGLKQRGKTVFLNSHILQEVELICDRVAIMAQGQIRASGTIDQLIDQHSTIDALQVTLEVDGAEADIRRCLEAWRGPEAANVVLQRTTETDPALTVRPRWRFQVAVTDQSQLDGLIDTLRRDALSLASLTRQRRRLEDVFLQLVAALEAPESKERGAA